MMGKKIILMLICLGAAMTNPGCTSRNWYEGSREVKRNDCYKLQSDWERDRCLEEIDGASYDQYKKEREQMINEEKEK